MSDFLCKTNVAGDVIALDKNDSVLIDGGLGVSSELLVIENGSTDPSTQSSASSWFAWSDWAGMVASIGCAIHCAAMPFVIAYLPALGLSFLADEAFHKWMAFGCFAIALTAFVPGLRKHGRLTPVIIGSAGLVMISVAAFGFAGECCAACETGSASVSADTSNVSVNAVPSADAEACTEACCPHCASGDSDASAGVTDKPDISSADLSAGALPTPNQWMGRIAPWLTPLGGIVLVFAHLLNRRYGCLCGCCSTEAATVSA